MSMCDRIVVLNLGQKIAEGLPAEVQQNRAVVDAYLGGRLEIDRAAGGAKSAADAAVRPGAAGAASAPGPADAV